MNDRIKKTFKNYFEKNQPTDNSLKDFGLIVGGIFLFLTIVLEVSQGVITLKYICLTLGLSLILLVVGNKKLLHYPYLAWMSLGMILSLAVAPVVIGIIYYVFFSPLALLKRIFSSNSSWLEYDKSASSYWIERTEKYEPEKSKTLF